ncbi:MAG: DNA translocase FtsK [Bacteroidota bacterium]
MAKNTSTRRKRSPRKKAKKPTGPISGLAQWWSGIKNNPAQRYQWWTILAWTILFLSVISLIACISFFFTGSADQSETEGGIAQAEQVKNWLGAAGAWIADLLIRRGFGFFGLLIPIYGFILGLIMLEDESEYYQAAKRLFKYVLFILFFGTIFISYFQLLIDPTHTDMGGGVGVSINLWLFKYIAKVGVAFLLLFAILIVAVVNFNAEIRASRLVERVTAGMKPSEKQTPKTANQNRKGGWKAALVKAMGVQAEDLQEDKTPVKKQGPKAKPVPVNKDTPKTPQPEPEKGQEVKLTLSEPNPADVKANSKEEKPQLELTIVETKDEPVAKVETKKLEQIGEDNIGRVVGDENRIEKIVPEKDQELENAEELFEDEVYDPTLELSGYVRPPFELLEDHGSGSGREVSREELENNKNKIVKTLGDYGIKIEEIKATIGPTVTLYEIVPAAGVRISKIRNLEDDIALGLAALGIRIIAPMPGKGTIGIEVPNSKPEIVSLRGVLTTEKFITSKFELPIAIGRNISNEVFIADLNKMPHLLIAGATGQGKSVGLNTVIASLLYKKHPAEVKFVLIDPKKVEMTLYASLKNHFIAQLPNQGDDPIITDVREAVDVLKSLCVEMDRRYDLLKKARVRNLKEYNTKFTNRKLSPKKGHEFLPYIILVIDELADMMMVAGKEVEMPIARLAQLARAVGIHLVVATQRPSVNVITGIIKANFPARMSYRVISKVDSRTILDANGADQLVGRGDLLLSTGSELIRIQNAFIDTPEVERIVDHISSQRGFPEPYLLPEVLSEDGDALGEDEPFEKDSRFEEAARLIVRYQIGSASLIQRKMKLGYNRAGRIIDQLERAGIVGAHSGSKAREVLMTDENELEQYLSKLS